MRVLFFTAIASANSQTLPGGASAADAINAAQQLLNAAIGRFDTNGDGRIDEKDQLSSAVLGVVLGSMDRNGDGVIDVNDFMPIINTLDVNGDGFVDLSDLTQAQRSALSIYDTNGDGRIDDADLAGILANLERNSDGSLSLDALPSPIRNAVQSALDGASGGFDAQLIQDLISRVNAGNINLDDLPANIRTQLEAALNSGLDDQIAPILTALRATPAGQEILDTMDTDEDGQLSAEEVLVGWRALEQLDPENLPIQPDGSVNISTLPAGIQRALRRSLDADHDGRIQPAEMQTWLESLGTEAVSARLLRRFDTNGDGVLDDAEVISLLPPQLQGHSLSISELPPTVASDLLLAASRVGLGNIDEISPARRLALPTQPTVAAVESRSLAGRHHLLRGAAHGRASCCGRAAWMAHSADLLPGGGDCALGVRLPRSCPRVARGAWRRRRQLARRQLQPRVQVSCGRDGVVRAHQRALDGRCRRVAAADDGALGACEHRPPRRAVE